MFGKCQGVLSLDRPNLARMDCPILAGLLAETRLRPAQVVSGLSFFPCSSYAALARRLFFRLW